MFADMRVQSFQGSNSQRVLEGTLEISNCISQCILHKLTHQAIITVNIATKLFANSDTIWELYSQLESVRFYMLHKRNKPCQLLCGPSTTIIRDRGCGSNNLVNVMLQAIFKHVPLLKVMLFTLISSGIFHIGGGE